MLCVTCALRWSELNLLPGGLSNPAACLSAALSPRPHTGGHSLLEGGEVEQVRGAAQLRAAITSAAPRGNL